MKKKCWHLHKREQWRIQVALDIEEESYSKHNIEGVFEVRLKDCIVSSGSEVQSLLYYINQMLEYKLSVYYMQPTDDVGVYRRGSWHVTPETEGRVAKRRWWPTPRFASYVKCRRTKLR